MSRFDLIFASSPLGPPGRCPLTPAVIMGTLRDPILMCAKSCPTDRVHLIVRELVYRLTCDSLSRQIDNNLDIRARLNIILPGHCRAGSGSHWKSPAGLTRVLMRRFKRSSCRHGVLCSLLGTPNVYLDNLVWTKTERRVHTWQYWSVSI